MCRLQPRKGGWLALMSVVFGVFLRILKEHGCTAVSLHDFLFVILPLSVCLNRQSLQASRFEADAFYHLAVVISLFLFPFLQDIIPNGIRSAVLQAKTHVEYSQLRRCFAHQISCPSLCCCFFRFLPSFSGFPLSQSIKFPKIYVSQHRNRAALFLVWRFERCCLLLNMLVCTK